VRKADWTLQLNEHIAEPGEIVFRHACKLGFEGIFSEAARLALCVGPLATLDQEQEPGRAGGQTGSRGRLGAVSYASNSSTGDFRFSLFYQRGGGCGLPDQDVDSVWLAVALSRWWHFHGNNA
jgi:hypothetical protein